MSSLGEAVLPVGVGWHLHLCSLGLPVSLRWGIFLGRPLESAATGRCFTCCENTPTKCCSFKQCRGVGRNKPVYFCKFPLLISVCNVCSLASHSGSSTKSMLRAIQNVCYLHSFTLCFLYYLGFYQRSRTISDMK